MGTTGLIYAAIVIAWAAYLVPLALRRSHNQARRNSIERFSSAMHVLSRREQRTSARAVVAPPRPDGVDRVVRPQLAVAKPASAKLANRPSSAPARRAAARRRRVLTVLVTLTAIVGVVSALGLLARWAFVLPLIGVVAFLGVARRQVRRASDAYWEAVAQSRPSVSNVVRRSAQRIDANHGVARQDTVHHPGPDEQPTELMHLDLADVEVHDVVPVKGSDGSALWDPIPVTLPTYVGQPAIRRQVRTVDLAAGDITSSARPATTPSAVEPADSRALDEPEDDAPRAVGE